MSRKNDPFTASEAVPHSPEYEKLRADEVKKLQAEQKEFASDPTKVEPVQKNAKNKDATKDEKGWAPLQRTLGKPNQGQNEGNAGPRAPRKIENNDTNNKIGLEISGQHLRLEPGWGKVLVGQKKFCEKATNKYLGYYAHYSYYQSRRQGVNTRKYRGVMIDIQNLNLNLDQYFERETKPNSDGDDSE